MNQDNNLESFLQNSLEDFKFEPPKKNRRKILLFLWFKNLYKFKIILFAVISSLLVLFFWNNNDLDNKLILKDEKAKDTLNINENPTFNRAKNDSDLKQNSAIKNSNSNEFKVVNKDSVRSTKYNDIQSDSNLNKKKSTVKNTIKGDGFAVKNFSNTSQTDNKNNLLLDVSLEENQENLNKPIVSNANEAINLENNVFVESDKEESIQNQLNTMRDSSLLNEVQLIKNNSLEESKINDNLEEKEDEQSKLKKSPLVYVDGGILLNQFFSKNKQLDYMPNFGIGLSTKILLNNYFAKTGVHFERIQFSYQSNYLKDTLIANYNSYYNIDTNVTMVLIMNQKLDSTTFQYVMYFDTIVKFKYDSTLVTDTNYVNSNIHKNAQQINNLNILTIPLNFGYQFNFNKHAISVSSGITTSIILKNSTHQNQFPPSLTLQPRLFNINYSLNLEYAYFLKPNLAIVTDFWFRENINSSFVNQNIKNQAFGFLLGCRLKL